MIAFIAVLKDSSKLKPASFCLLTREIKGASSSLETGLLKAFVAKSANLEVQFVELSFSLPITLGL